MQTQTATQVELGNCAPALTAKLAPWMTKVLSCPDLLSELISNHGSPCHVVVDSEFERNVGKFMSAFAERGVKGRLFFARKANKLPCFVAAANRNGIGVDTASLAEVIETLALGVPAESIIVTAIGKERELVSKAISSGCLLVVDNFDELDLIQNIAQALGKRARIGLRFAGFEHAGRKVFSRFGMALEDSRAVIEQVSHDANLQLEILHAHLDRYDIGERAAAGRKLIELVDLAKSFGADVKGVDLGGGILMRYLNDATQWKHFQQELLASVKGERTSFTFRGDGLGYTKIGNEIVGQPDLYPAHNDLAKQRFISAVLDNTEGGGVPLYKLLNERGLEIYFEPGRSLLDNCGMTLAKVTFRKKDTEGNFMVGLAMNRMNLRPFRAEFCCDPLFVSTEEGKSTTQNRHHAEPGAFLVGNLCSESDLIYRRRIKLAKAPQPGDLCAFPNTAGYLAHHMEIGTHGSPLPKNILLESDSLEVKGVY
jgi:diaminopimelate decarboxylase